MEGKNGREREGKNGEREGKNGEGEKMKKEKMKTGRIKWRKENMEEGKHRGNNREEWKK